MLSGGKVLGTGDKHQILSPQDLIPLYLWAWSKLIYTSQAANWCRCDWRSQSDLQYLIFGASKNVCFPILTISAFKSTEEVEGFKRQIIYCQIIIWHVLLIYLLLTDYLFISFLLATNVWIVNALKRRWKVKKKENLLIFPCVCWCLIQRSQRSALVIPDFLLTNPTPAQGSSCNLIQNNLICRNKEGFF